MRIVHIRPRSLCFLKSILFTDLVFLLPATAAFCQESPDLVVALINQGPGPLPPVACPTGYSPALQLYKDNQPFGAWSLDRIDPGRTLQQPGGAVFILNGELVYRGECLS